MKRSIRDKTQKNYQDLKREVKRLWNLRTVQVVHILVGALGTVTRDLDK